MSFPAQGATLTFMRQALVVLSAGVLLSCSSQPVGTGSLKVVVTLQAGLKSRCARVVARGNSQRESTPILLADRTSFTVGVAQDVEPLDVEVQSLGFSDDACTTLTVPAETSETRAARFTSPATEVVLTLRLEPVTQADGGVDRDGDGSTSDVDCDDGNPAINPRAAESCGNAADDDCDGFVDCLDAQCNLQPCGTGGQCQGGGCVAPNELGLCFDALDNDLDGTIDCDDTDCPQGARCNDSNACTLVDACGGPGVGCVGGANAVCDMPPAAQCFTPVGQCLPQGGACSYAVMAGSCMDGLACTDNDACTADGGCVGTPRVCGTPPACRGPGSCSEVAGACVFPPLATGVCSDGDNCTVNDGCDGDGGCAGLRVSCVSPAECLTVAPTCEMDGGCIFTPRAGACDGGTCNGAGACVATPPLFGYPTSNFTQGQLPASAGAVVVSCNVTINTSSADGGVSWTTCPTGVPAPAFRVIPAGANTAALLFMDSLTINTGAVVTAIGARPLIFAVQGAVVINGGLSVGSGGAGSDLDCAPGSGSPGTASGNPQTAGGGGGAGFLTDGTDGSDGLNGGPKGALGSSNGQDALIPLRGGCRGGNGGRATGTGSGSGLGGRGGGAVQVSSGGAITINASGTIAASGEGGRGGEVDQRIGGGGGGTGGAILLEAMTLTVNPGGAVVANGGAGGEGSGWGGNPYSGVDGQDGQRGTVRALCPAFVCGGNGGSGGALAGGPTAATSGGTGSCAANPPGGGGGGSAGRIRLNAVNGCTLTAAVISPARTGLGAGCP